MKLLKRQLKDGIILFKVTNTDDLWYLSHIITPGDRVLGRITRKIKLGEKEAAVKKSMLLELEVDRIDFADNVLRVLGLVTEGKDDVPSGSHQSMNIAVDSDVTLKKERWFKEHLQRLEDAQREQTAVLLCVYDREDATFALLGQTGYKMISDLKGEVEKKQFKTDTKDFFAAISEHITGLAERHRVQRIVLGCSSMWKQNLMDNLPDEIRKKANFIVAHDTGVKGIEEVLSAPELQKLLKEDRTAQQIELVDEILMHIAKDDLATYGFDNIKHAVELGAVAKLVVTDTCLKTFKDRKTYEALDDLFLAVERMRGEVHIIDGKSTAGKKLDGIAGLAASLRYIIQ